MAVLGARAYGPPMRSAIVGGAVGALLVAGVGWFLLYGQPQVAQVFRSECTVGLAGTALQITYEGPGATTACDDAVNHATSDAPWYRVDEPAGQLVCRIPETDNPDLMLTVRDQGALMLYGHQVCSSYTGS